ncbi:hypothetical protein Pan161_21220 [Gimesia algae]|uniref:Uncharacterized protein n=1 Tax=Gimesia algae TaxID=2527971 RepID=A0A517VBT8_9PLAN|nr:hypothetical protein Pan161_21220 [Gimesia algae]
MPRFLIHTECENICYLGLIAGESDSMKRKQYSEESFAFALRQHEPGTAFGFDESEEKAVID